MGAHSGVESAAHDHESKGFRQKDIKAFAVFPGVATQAWRYPSTLKPMQPAPFVHRGSEFVAEQRKYSIDQARVVAFD
ncbi:hypothetical protein [Azospirillum doebereinerae]|uniref:Uncharacterized protein n=1 Tax=Azospirillum doebereinerae TaxID=92933 RepID=A0A3S0UZB2_9PROT|nr:hypothetical protein [Azospirillum doebereinerae]RUQ66749.1 hypothetical protein EJ913_21390 [Azospirillum doebereinerae]